MLHHPIADGLVLQHLPHPPDNPLNSGFHWVGLFLVRGGMAATYRLDEAIGFEVVDNSERKFAWYGKEPGVLSPQLYWETKYLSPRLDSNPQPIPR